VHQLLKLGRRSASAREALHNIYLHTLKVKLLTHVDLNALVSSVMYVPGAVLLDLELVRLGSLFHSNDFVHGQNGVGDNWAKGCESHV
jgi:hypothetical protein